MILTIWHGCRMVREIEVEGPDDQIAIDPWAKIIVANGHMLDYIDRQVEG